MKDLIFETRYLNPLTDFGFHKLFGTESSKELLIDFLNGIIKEELETNADKWLFTLKNLPLFEDRPKAIQGIIFDKLFQEADTKKFTKREMKEYNKSILKYRDVKDAVGVAHKEGLQEGLQEGRNEGRNEERILTLQKSLQRNISIEDIIFLTGFTKQQILEYSKNKE